MWVHPDTAAVCLNNGFGEVQPKTGAFCLSDCFIRAIETAEYVGDVARIDSRALIADTDDNLFRPDLAVDANFAIRGIFDGIGDKVR